VCLGAYAHQDVPFEKLVEELQPERDLSRAPLFQVKLILQNAPRERLELGETRLRGFDGGEERLAKLDLTVVLTDTGRNQVGTVSYSRDLFEPATIERLMSHYTNALRSISLEIESPISELRLLDESEREQIVVEWNETGRLYPNDKCIHELIAEQAALTPERIALVCEGLQLSYRELNRRTNQLGNHLRKLGVGPEVVVGLCLERSVEMVVALLGALKAGASYLPLDPETPLERLSLMLEESAVGVTLTERGLKERLSGYEKQTICLSEAWEKIGEESQSEPESETDAGNMAYVIYTSGSTGRPKGVMNTHAGIRNRLLWMQDQYELDENDRVLQKTTYSFDVSVWEFLWPLMRGAALVMAQRGGHRDSQYLLNVIKQEGITTIHFVPSMLEVFLEEKVEEATSLRRVICSGEALTKNLEQRLLSRTQAQVSNLYGPTEAAIDVSYWISERDRAGQSTPIGRPIANIQMHILGQELEVAPLGARGEIYISGIGLARGYIGRPELTGERFIPNRFSRNPGERSYRTGDVGRYLSDGNIEFIGRTDKQVKVRGYRIELGEIEAVLNEHRLVKQSVVIVNEDERGNKRLLGYVVGEEKLVVAELRKLARERLPEYMVPEAIVALKEMPVTANGKIDRQRLPLVALTKGAAGQLEQEYRRPPTPVEEIIVGIFEEVLKLDGVGIHDNFFEIGGHSLLATQVISRVRNRFGVEIGVRSIFKDPTVEGLGRVIEGSMRAGDRDASAPLVRAEREIRGKRMLPLSFAQQRLWFIDQLEPDSVAYNMPTAIRLEGRLNFEALESVINEIVRRHEILRTRIEVVDGEPVQVIDEWEPKELERVDLTGLTREEREEEVRRVGREEAQTRFDLSKGPLLRVKALELEREQHAVFFTMHHIVSDGWSMGILAREIGTLYQAYSAGQSSPLEELPIQYADYAVWQREWLKGQALDEMMRYWRRQLENAPELELPTTSKLKKSEKPKSASHRLVFPPDVAKAIKGFRERKGVTLFMVLLAAFATALHRLTGQRDLVIGADVANRNRAELEPLIGFFINELLLRVRIEGDPTFDQLLAQVRETALDGYLYQDVPFNKLVEMLNPERRNEYSPFIRAKLVVQNIPSQPLALPALTIGGAGGMSGLIEGLKCDFLLTFVEREQELVAHVNYNQALIQKSTTVALLRNIERLLTIVTEDSTLKLSALMSKLMELQKQRQQQQIAVSLKTIDEIKKLHD
jgi:amino acid adenylation domain-containing protein